MQNRDSFILHSAFFIHRSRKAGRYKLAAPVSKTGSDLRSREHYPGLPPAFASQLLDGEGCPPKLQRRWAKFPACGLPLAGHFNHQRQEINMTALVQFVQKWLRKRLRKPAQPKPKTLSKKDRQVLPTLPKQSRSVIFSQENSPAGYRVLWRL